MVSSLSLPLVVLVDLLRQLFNISANRFKPFRIDIVDVQIWAAICSLGSFAILHCPKSDG